MGNFPQQVCMKESALRTLIIIIIIIIIIILLFRAAPAAYGGSQARGGIGAVAAGLCHGHTTAQGNPGSLTH